MNELCNWKLNKKIFAAIAAGLFVSVGSGTAWASESDPAVSYGIAEQMQQQTVRGVVVDQNGDPVIGASIQVKGTGTGVVTDLDGRFTLNVDRGAVLIVSYIGYKTQEVEARPNMNIALREDTEVLDEVVVVGYGVQKKKLVTGATVQVKGEDIAKMNTVDVLGAVQSSTPGVNIVQNSGNLGAGYKVNIRGLGTTGDYSPLYVIDGVAGASIDGLNPSDIESMDVLKDAASSAIYGARAANGVILITTKRGKEGVSEVSYDGYVGWQNLYKIPTILNAQEFMAIQDEGRMMDGLPTYNWDQYIPAADLKAIREGTWQGTNWLKEVLNKDALVQNHSLNITGGNDRSRYAFGFAYTKQDATLGVPTDVPGLNRYNARVNSDHVVFKKGDLEVLKVGQTLNYKYQTMHGSFAADDIYWNSMHNMLVMSPLMHVYNAEGEYYIYADQLENGYNWDTSSGANKNPIAYMDWQMNQNESLSHYLQGSAYAELQPIKNLRIKTQFGYMLGVSSYRSYIPRFDALTATLSNADDKVTQSVSTNHQWSWENTASYSFNVDDHNFDVLVGQSIEKWGMGASMSGSAIGSNFSDFKHAYLSNVPLTSSSTQSLSGSPISTGALASFFGRINYNYKEKYMATLIMRGDGSSTFARGHRWGYFPSVSAGWVITNEDFMESTNNWLDFLKLRASWGQNGNCNVSVFQWLSRITTSNTYGGYPFGGSMDFLSTGAYTEQLTNPDLMWETQEQFDLGLDARFFNSRLGMEFDYYIRNTRDWLVDAPVLASFGASGAVVNGGNVRNTGVEIGLHWNDNIGKDFQYGANLSLAHNKNEVTKIANADGIIHGVKSVLWEGADECYRAEVGKPIGFFYGYKSNGIFQNQEQIDNYTGAKLNGDATQPGDVIWADVNGDGAIGPEDRTEIGNPNPDLTMGLSLNASYKAIDFSITTYGAFGQQILKCYRDYSTSPTANYTSEIFERWHGEGTSNKLPRLGSTSNTNWNQISDIYIEDGDYLKIKNITLGFDFKKAFKQLPVQQLRLYVTAQNVFTFTGYSGMDPEIGYGAGQGWASGIDLGYYPSARTYMVGLNVKF